MENKNLRSLEEKTIHLLIWGSEREFVSLDEKGNVIDYLMSALIPSDLYFYIDDKEVACDPDLPVNVGEPHVVNLINNDDQVISGIREYYNESGYACDIEVKGEFDINKVTLNVLDLCINIGDDKYSEGPFLNSILYDGEEYSNFEVEESSGKGSEIVWGEGEGDDDWEDDDDEEDDDDDDYRPLEGMRVLATGKFENYSREEIRAMIESKGGKYASAVTGTLDLLVCGKNVGKLKIDKANDLGIKMINEAEFNALISASDK